MTDPGIFDTIRASAGKNGLEVVRKASGSLLNTARIGGMAEVLVKANSVDGLREVVEAATRSGAGYRVVGKGSNLLFPDGDIEKVLILLSGGVFREVRANEVSIKAGAGVPLGKLISECACNGLSGMEGLIGIPGTVGGAVVMNASYKNAVADILEEIVILDTEMNLKTLKRRDIDLSYRSSSLRGCVVVEATFKLKTGDPGDISDRMKELFAEKMSKQPIGEKTLGCVFRNPAEGHMTSGMLIDRSGLKGLSVGGAMVSEKHANFFVNAGGATCSDYLRLMAKVRETVSRRFGIKLEPEIEVL